MPTTPNFAHTPRADCYRITFFDLYLIRIIECYPITIANPYPIRYFLFFSYPITFQECYRITFHEPYSITFPILATHYHCLLPSLTLTTGVDCYLCYLFFWLLPLLPLFAATSACCYLRFWPAVVYVSGQVWWCPCLCRCCWGPRLSYIGAYLRRWVDGYC